MKMSAAFVFVVVLLLGCFSSSDCEDVCDQNAAMGDNVIIKLQHKLTSSESLKWFKENDIMLYWKNNKFVTKKSGDIDPKDGSLKLTGVMATDKAGYRPEVYRSDGKSVGVLPSTRLCVFERVGKPKVTFSCRDSKKETRVEFTCTAAQNNTTPEFEWLQNNKVVEKEKTSTLKYVVTKAETEAVTCKVSNEVSSMISDSVTHSCYKSGGIAIPDKVFGIDIWIIVGGGAGIVVLLIILVIICCLRAKRTKRMRLKDEEELRLDFARPEQHPQYNHPADHHHHHHQHHQHQHQHRHQQQQPAGHTGPRQHRSRQHRNQPLPKTPDQTNGVPQPSPRRSAQVPKVANDEQPPPLPQPRKKTPRKV